MSKNVTSNKKGKKRQKFEKHSTGAGGGGKLLSSMKAR